MDKLLDTYHHGDMFDAYKHMGCHFDKATGTAVFRVWSTRAVSISVIGDFNGWDVNANRMEKITEAGLWEAKGKGVKLYDNYKSDFRDLYTSAIRSRSTARRSRALTPRWSTSIILSGRTPITSRISPSRIPRR